MATKHLLVATDGSPRSRKAVAAAVQLAQPLGARITGLYVLAEGVPTLFSGDKLYASGVIGREYRQRARRDAKAALEEVRRQATAAGVRCGVASELAAQPWRAILGTARSRGCDLIVMASHGRGPVQAMLLGSQTAKVLAHSKIPVLVCR